VDKFDLKNWYIWPCRSYPGDYNMAADHILARAMITVIDRPLLRFFTWNPYCISLGYHQRTSNINLPLCRQNRIDVVRRPTGGRAILHAAELTYSVVHPFNDRDTGQFYHMIHTPMVEALHVLNIPAEFEPVQADFRQIYKTDRAYACFATSARYEVEIEGKKLIGSAQRIYEQAILQHGSILLGNRHESLIDFLNFPKNKKVLMKEYIRKHTASVWQYHPLISAEELALLVQEKFESYFGIQFVSFIETEFFQQKLKPGKIGQEFSIQTNGQLKNDPVFLKTR
jgi:lipoate-protein ligase A